MAQPLARENDTISGGLDEAAQSLEKAFLRLEAAVAETREKHHSLKAGQEKLNLLLQETEEKSAQLREVTGKVIERLAHTIDKLENTEE